MSPKPTYKIGPSSPKPVNTQFNTARKVMGGPRVTQVQGQQQMPVGNAGTGGQPGGQAPNPLSPSDPSRTQVPPHDRTSNPRHLQLTPMAPPREPGLPMGQAAFGGPLGNEVARVVLGGSELFHERFYG